jgi:hypothetical protein
MKMILPKQLVIQINEVKKELERIAFSNSVTDSMSDWLYDLCQNLDDLAN